MKRNVQLQEGVLFGNDTFDDYLASINKGMVPRRLTIYKKLTEVWWGGRDYGYYVARDWRKIFNHVNNNYPDCGIYKEMGIR